jgi:hypothetical protein
MIDQLASVALLNVCVSGGNTRVRVSPVCVCSSSEELDGRKLGQHAQTPLMLRQRVVDVDTGSSRHSPTAIAIIVC